MVCSATLSATLRHARTLCGSSCSGGGAPAPPQYPVEAVWPPPQEEGVSVLDQLDAVAVGLRDLAEAGRGDRGTERRRGAEMRGSGRRETRVSLHCSTLPVWAWIAASDSRLTRSKECNARNLPMLWLHRCCMHGSTARQRVQEERRATL